MARPHGKTFTTAGSRRDAKTAFLAAFRRTYTVQAAAEAVGVSRRTVYDWRDHDSDFAAEFAEASEDVNDTIREEVWRRAMKGWIETTKVVRSDGRTVTTKVRRYDDRLLVLLAKSRLPEFHDRLDVAMRASAVVAPEQMAAWNEDAEMCDLFAKLLERATYLDRSIVTLAREHLPMLTPPAEVVSLTAR
jgi:hypothetical protein